MIASADALATYLRTRYAGSERAASVVEFGLLAALIAAVCVIAVTFLGDRATGLSGLAGS